MIKKTQRLRDQVKNSESQLCTKMVMGECACGHAGQSKIE